MKWAWWPRSTPTWAGDVLVGDRDFCSFLHLATLAELYGLRSSVELNLRHLKQAMRMDVLKMA